MHPGQRLAPGLAVEDLGTVLLVELDHVSRSVLGTAVAARHRQSNGDDSPGRGPRDHIEQLGDRSLRAVFDLGQDDGRDDPAHAATIEGEDGADSFALPGAGGALPGHRRVSGHQAR